MSREIDRKVAEALGWIGIRRELETGSLWGVRPIDGVLIPVYRYSTDIAAAIRALEEYCNKMAWSAELRIGGECRECDITEPEGDIVAHSNAATLPLAICNAIIAAATSPDAEATNA